MTYNYSSTAGEYALAAPAAAAATLITLDSVTGLPSVPFKLVIDPGLTTEEIVKVTNVAGTTLTVTRGWDSSLATDHSGLAVVRHMMTAEDLRLSRQHEAATTDVHGTTGALADLASAQAFENKDFTAATNTFPASLATAASVTTVSNNLATHEADTSAHGVAGAVVGTTDTQALSNKDLSAATNVFPATLATDAELSAHTGATAAHGTTGAVVGTTDTQTLTNKNLTSATNTLPWEYVTDPGGTTDVDGWLTVTHGRSFTPTDVVAWSRTPNSRFAVFWGSMNITATTVDLRWMNSSGGPLSSLGTGPLGIIYFR